MRTVADRHRLIAAYHNRHCWRPFREYQHRWPWTTLNHKNMGFKWIFRYFRLRCTLRVNVRWIWPGMKWKKAARTSVTGAIAADVSFFHREICELRQPIAVKLCHVIGSMFSFII